MYCSPSIAGLSKLRRLRCAKLISRGGRTEVHQGFWYGNLRKTDHLEYIRNEWRIILKRMYRKYNGRARSGLMLLEKEM